MPTNIHPEWIFNVKNSFSKSRDPVQGEFFNDEDNMFLKPKVRFLFLDNEPIWILFSTDWM